PVLFTSLRCMMPQESGLFEAAHHYDFGFAARTFDEIGAIIRKGASEWNRKRESIPQFYEVATAVELVQRIQIVGVEAEEHFSHERRRHAPRSGPREADGVAAPSACEHRLHCRKS